MASVGEVAAALAERLATITGLEVIDYVPEQLNPPTCFLVLGEMLEDTFGYETMTVNFDVVVLQSRNSMRVSTQAFYTSASPERADSVWKAIGGDPSLGLSDGTSARVGRLRGLTVEEVAAIGYLGGVFEVIVTTPGE